MFLLKMKKPVLPLLVCVLLLAVIPAFPDAARAVEARVESVETPYPETAPGRYEGTVTVSVYSPTPDANVYYTLDGMTPEATSPRYDGTPIVLTESANLSLIAEKDSVWSEAISYGYIVKSSERPLLQFVAMSDVHKGPGTPEQEQEAHDQYTSNFDVIASIFPNPDAIMLIGDNINDNWNGLGPHHAFIREMFEAQLARKGWEDTTRIQFAMGNHDATVAEARSLYPAEWFTEQPNGYYEKTIGGYSFFFLNGNNYNGDMEQRNWLKERLAALISEPGQFNEPIFINIHQPILGTVMDGQQASNSNLYTDLKDYPQAIVLSGHSHLNINDQRSIHQKDFTSVNVGSMSYIQVERGYSLITDEGVVSRFELPQNQAQFIEVYEDRVEIERVALNADAGSTFKNGVWQGGNRTPFKNKGTLAGDKWVVKLQGDTAEEIKENFIYTERNKTAPAFVENPQITVTENVYGVPELSFRQAKDDQLVHHYDINIMNARTGEDVKSYSVASEFYVSPTPSVLRMPIEGLSEATAYFITITAVDSYGNRSEKVQSSFMTGGSAPDPKNPADLYTYEQLTEKIGEAEQFAAYIASTTGLSVPAQVMSALESSLAGAKALTANDQAAIIDQAYIDLMWALRTGKEAIVYDFIPKSSFTIDSYSSYDDFENNLPHYILDDDYTTIWHTRWKAPVPSFPHWIVIDMKDTFKLSGIQRTSRTKLSAMEFPKEFQLYASDRLSDLSDPAFLANEENRANGVFGKTSTGTVYQDFVALDKPIQGRYVKLVITSTYGTGSFTSMSEIDFIGEAVAPAVTAGDLNEDGNVNLLDVTEILQLIVAGSSEADEAKRGAADINGDQKVDTNDVLALLQLIADRLVLTDHDSVNH
ncbi:discoidin domain-containing protein [Paenibacillus sp. J5C_2022]|uniref:discoidin domain-containing protein n=1 Tax=Paenibacillus sp. J5C2022 TaxID=2977129 RepID=UPI0021CF472D|nr:chitobiase/beta-hexosaminidase C-terminal domain-containing protein [Paenibacillus sp. J5C2022]MCU6710179.1 discoidin domain-containing protein [Paenibacillus sp. J5C2022]